MTADDPNSGLRTKSSKAASFFSQPKINARPIGDIVAFGSFRLHLRELLLTDTEARIIPVKPKAIEALCVLLRENGRIVSKEELMSDLWPDRFVEESNLTQNIYLLRQALGTREDGQSWIETIPKRGYRFSAPFRVVHDGLESVSDPSNARSPETGVAPSQQAWRRRFKTYGWPVLLVVGGILAVTLLLPAGSTGREKEGTADATSPSLAFGQIRLSRLSADGDVTDAAVSPDGRTVVFRKLDETVWLQNLVTSNRFRVLSGSPERKAGSFRFSPDGNWLYYNLATSGEMTAVYRLPLPSGEPERIVGDLWSGFALSPNGNEVAFLREHVRRGETHLIVASTNGSGEERRLASRSHPHGFMLWEESLSWSPDGDHIALLVQTSEPDGSALRHQIVTLEVASGKEAAVAGRAGVAMKQVEWSPDGRGLLVIARELPTAPYQVWHVSWPDGVWLRVTNDLDDYDGLSISADGQRIVSSQVSRVAHLWLIPEGGSGPARPLTTGEHARDGTGGLSWTDDGRIVYSTQVNDSQQIAVLDPEAGHMRLLRFQSDGVFSPVASSDGHHVVFAALRRGRVNLWRMGLDGSRPLQLTSGLVDYYPAMTPDGRRVIYSSSGSPGYRLWTVPIDGGHPATILHPPSRITLERPAVSPDARLLAAPCYLAEDPNPWKLAVLEVSGGSIERLFDVGPMRGFPRWTADNRAILYLSSDYSEVRRQTLAGGQPSLVLRLNDAFIANFALSPDGSRIVFSRQKVRSDIVQLQTNS